MLGIGALVAVNGLSVCPPVGVGAVRVVGAGVAGTVGDPSVHVGALSVRA